MRTVLVALHVFVGIALLVSATSSAKESPKPKSGKRRHLQSDRLADMGTEASWPNSNDETCAGLNQANLVEPGHESVESSESLIVKAQGYFETDDLARCIETCDKILWKDPRIWQVDEMKSLCQRLQHHGIEHKSEIYEASDAFVILATRIRAGEQLAFLLEDEDADPSVVAKRRPVSILGEYVDEMSAANDREIEAKLKQLRIDLDYENQSLQQIVDYLREVSALNWHIDYTSIPDPAVDIFTIHVKDMPIDSALKVLLPQRNMAYRVEDGIIIITTAERLKKRVNLELYNVQDLTYAVQSFPSVNLTLDDPGQGTAALMKAGAKQQFLGEDLANLVRNSIQKDHWDEGSGQSVIFQNGLLIVRNSPEIHKQIRKFLGDLRASVGILVSVEDRFLSVEENTGGVMYSDLPNPSVALYREIEALHVEGQRLAAAGDGPKATEIFSRIVRLGEQSTVASEANGFVQSAKSWLTFLSVNSSVR